MPSDRRFSEREIREVFERAAAQQQAAEREPDGLTLAEMQEIAASSGIDPQYVARAAEAVALGEPEQGRTTWGPVPTGVYRTELLPGAPTDALWASVLSDARHTFAAEGKARTDGALREWRNGNLRVTLEPAGAGSRLSLRTRKDGAAPGLVNMAVLVALGLLAVGISLVGYDDPAAALGWIWMVVGGTLGAAGTWYGQRTWAATREAQMEGVAARARARSDAHSGAPAVAETAPPVAPALDLDALGDVPDAEAARRARGQRSGA